MSKDALGSSFLIIGGVVFGWMSVVGVSFLVSDYTHSIPACGTTTEISGFSPGPLPASAMSQRAQILKLNLSGAAQTPITGYQQQSLLQSAAEVSKANITLNISNIGLSASGLHGKGSNLGTPGMAMGASGAGATTSFGGVGHGAPVSSVPSATTFVPPCAPPGGPARAPSLSTAGGASSLAANAGVYAAASPKAAPIAAGLGSNGGIAELTAGGGNAAAAFGLYHPSSLLSQSLGSSFQEPQVVFSSGGPPVLGAVTVGAVSTPYGQQAMANWIIGGLSIPASTPSALDVATGPVSGTNPNSSTGIDYLAGYAAPDSGITYLSQFNVQSGANNYLSQISSSLTPQSSGSGRHPSSSGSGPADLSNTTPTDASNSTSSSSSSSSTSGASPTSSQASSPSTGTSQNTQGHSN